MIFFNKKTSLGSIGTAKVNFCLSRQNAWLLWLCQCLNIAVIALELSTWMLAIILLSLAWQALLLHNSRDREKTGKKETTANHSTQRQHNHLQKKQRQKQQQQATIVSPIILGIFALLGCLVIAITAREVGILASMVHLLCFSYVLKAFELKARRDFYQLLLLGLFVLVTSLIFRQDLLFSFITLTLLVINLSVLLQFFSSEKTFARDIKVMTIILAQSAMLAVVLFLVFPRLSPFWQMPRAKSAETGLSDTVKPGDIANLSRSTKLAFRADFGQQSIPNYSQLYWRAMVLEDYDGRQWTRIKAAHKNTGKQATSSTFSVNINDSDIVPLNYQVTIEPSFQKYLFALAPAITSNEGYGIRAKNDYTFISSKIITEAKSYQLSSFLSLPLSLVLSEHSRTVNLNYPQGSNPRLEQMALQLKHIYPDAQARAQAVLSRINKQNYSYTLQPPLLLNNSLDQFFFDTQAGFCVHYASAFTFIMRASGIPARLVTGYLGGEYNGSNNEDEYSEKGHLSIYQYDAHAWSEIWVQDKGWVRVDPTGAVDPERVNSGWSNELLQEQSKLNNELFSLYQMKNIAWLNSLRLQFDILDYQWTRWVIGFNSKQQYNLLKQWFGNMASWKFALIITIALVISMVMLMLFLHFFNRSTLKKQRLSKWQLVYQKALGKLAKQGIVKPVAMTVNDFSSQVRAQYPELAIVFTRLSVSYSYLSYQVLSTDQQLKHSVKIQQHYRDFLQILKKQP
ncbi:MAG: transglutaminase-like putative cysteine protease [Colwellia sp.]|jgi:transglutaminase-like putative cysteine protease